MQGCPSGQSEHPVQICWAWGFHSTCSWEPICEVLHVCRRETSVRRDQLQSSGRLSGLRGEKPRKASLRPRSSTGLGLPHHIHGMVRVSCHLGTIHILYQVILCREDCPGHVGCFSSIPGFYPLDASGTSPASCDNQKCLPVLSDVLG